MQFAGVDWFEYIILRNIFWLVIFFCYIFDDLLVDRISLDSLGKINQVIRLQLVQVRQVLQVLPQEVLILFLVVSLVQPPSH